MASDSKFCNFWISVSRRISDSATESGETVIYRGRGSVNMDAEYLVKS